MYLGRLRLFRGQCIEWRGVFGQDFGLAKAEEVGFSRLLLRWKTSHFCVVSISRLRVHMIVTIVMIVMMSWPAAGRACQVRSSDDRALQGCDVLWLMWLQGKDSWRDALAKLGLCALQEGAAAKQHQQHRRASSFLVLRLSFFLEGGSDPIAFYLTYLDTCLGIYSTGHYA